jgi:PAS domain S-box-containing protein
MLKIVLVLSLFPFFLKIASASDTLTIRKDIENYDVSQYIHSFTDSTSTLIIEQIANNDFQNKFKFLNQSPINLGVNKHSHWFVFNVINNSNSEDWILETHYPTLNEVTFYFFDSENKLDTIIFSGKNIKNEPGQIYTNSITLKPPFHKGKVCRVFINVKTESFVILPISIISTRAYIEKDRKELSILYLIYGIIIALVTFNFILFFLTRELNYLLLTLYLATLSLNAFYMYGYGFDFFPNIDLFIKNRMRQILFGIGSSIFLYFTINYLELKKYKTLYRIIISLIALSVVYTISLFFRELPQDLFSKYSPFLYLSGAIINFYAGIYTFRKGERLALYYIISFSFVTIASIIYYFTLFNFIPFNEIDFNINSLGTVLFGMLLTIGLIEKITAIRQEKAKSKYLEKIIEQLNIEIDERIKAENSLRESEEKFRLLFELSPQPVSLTEMETGLIIEANQQMERITGFSQQQLIGKTSLELGIISREDRNIVLAALKNNQEVTGLEINLHSAKGQTINCLAYIHLIKIKGENILVSVFSDITDLKLKQQKINMLSTALQQSANAVVITNTVGIIEYVNPSLLNITGYDLDEIIGETPSIFKSGEFSTSGYQNLWKTILSGEKWSGEFHNRKKNGDLFWDHTTISPVFDSKGIITNFIAVKEEITQKRQRQEALRLSEIKLRELNATKDKFFSIIAHDLMNPFNAMLGFTRLLIETLKAKKLEEGLHFASIIDHSSHRIFDLFQNLLIWSRSQSGQITYNPSPVKVIELVMNAINVLKDVALHKNIEIEIELNKEDAVVVDQNMIATVLRNLVSNAIKFSSEGSKIKVSAQKQDKSFLFQVADSGIGMSEQMINELFMLNKNISTQGSIGEVGTGLGLVICREFIVAHSGEIWVESEPGKGSRFFFSIPQE